MSSKLRHEVLPGDDAATQEVPSRSSDADIDVHDSIVPDVDDGAFASMPPSPNTKSLLDARTTMPTSTQPQTEPPLKFPLFTRPPSSGINLTRDFTFETARPKVLDFTGTRNTKIVAPIQQANPKIPKSTNGSQTISRDQVVSAPSSHPNVHPSVNHTHLSRSSSCSSTDTLAVEDDSTIEQVQLVDCGGNAALREPKPIPANDNAKNYDDERGDILNIPGLSQAMDEPDSNPAEQVKINIPENPSQKLNAFARPPSVTQSSFSAIPSAQHLVAQPRSDENLGDRSNPHRLRKAPHAKPDRDHQLHTQIDQAGVCKKIAKATSRRLQKGISFSYGQGALMVDKLFRLLQWELSRDRKDQAQYYSEKLCLLMSELETAKESNEELTSKLQALEEEKAAAVAHSREEEGKCSKYRDKFVSMKTFLEGIGRDYENLRAENASSQKRYSELFANERSGYEEELGKLRSASNSQIVQLMEKNQSTQQGLRQAVIELNQLRADKAILESQLRDKESLLQSSNEREATLESMLNSTNAIIAGMKETLGQKYDSVMENMAEIISKQSKVENKLSMNSMGDGFLKALEELKARNESGANDLNGMLTHLESMLADVLLRVDGCAGSVEQTSSSIGTFESSLKDHIAEIKQDIHSRDSLTSEFATLRERNLATEERLSVEQQVVSDLRKALELAGGNETTFSLRISELESELARLRTEISTCKEQKDRQIDQIQTENSALKKQIAEQHIELSKHSSKTTGQENAEKLRSQLAEFQERIKAQEVEIVKIKKEKEQVAANLTRDANRLRQNREREFENLQHQADLKRDSLERQIERLSKEKHELQARFTNLEDRIRAKDAESDTLRQAHSNCHLEQTTKNAQIDKLIAELKLKDAQKAVLVRSGVKKDSELAAVRTARDKALATNKALEHKCAEMRNEHQKEIDDIDKRHMISKSDTQTCRRRAEKSAKELKARVEELTKKIEGMEASYQQVDLDYEALRANYVSELNDSQQHILDLEDLNVQQEIELQVAHEQTKQLKTFASEFKERLWATELDLRDSEGRSIRNGSSQGGSSAPNRSQNELIEASNAGHIPTQPPQGSPFKKPHIPENVVGPQKLKGKITCSPQNDKQVEEETLFGDQASEAGSGHREEANTDLGAHEVLDKNGVSFKNNPDGVFTQDLKTFAEFVGSPVPESQAGEDCQAPSPLTSTLSILEDVSTPDGFRVENGQSSHEAAGRRTSTVQQELIPARPPSQANTGSKLVHTPSRRGGNVDDGGFQSSPDYVHQEMGNQRVTRYRRQQEHHRTSLQAGNVVATPAKRSATQSHLDSRESGPNKRGASFSQKDGLHSGPNTPGVPGKDDKLRTPSRGMPSQARTPSDMMFTPRSVFVNSNPKGKGSKKKQDYKKKRYDTRFTQELHKKAGT